MAKGLKDRHKDSDRRQDSHPCTEDKKNNNDTINGEGIAKDRQEPSHEDKIAISGESTKK